MKTVVPESTEFILIVFLKKRVILIFSFKMVSSSYTILIMKKKLSMSNYHVGIYHIALR